MEVSIAGMIIAALIATICMFGRRVAIITSICAFAFPSTALVTLTSLGGSSITVPQFGLVCLFITALSSGDLAPKISNIFKTEASAQIIALFTIFAVVGAYIMPRLFTDVTEVFSLARSSSGRGNVLSTVPLSPSSGNITQPFYFLGNLAGFLSILVLSQSRKTLDMVVAGLIGLVIVHTLGGAIDFVSKYGVGFDLLDFLRTAKYAMLIDVDVLSFKRIVGLYPEASSFAYASIAYTALMFGFWRIMGIPLSGLLFFFVLGCLAVSTSSTAYFCLAFLAVVYTLVLIKQSTTGYVEVLSISLALAVLLVIILILALIVFAPKLLEPYQDLIQRMVFNKADSESARQRFGWNMQAVTNFMQTYGMGAGLGSLRSSSWILTLLAELGLIGALSYGAFVASLFAPAGIAKSSRDRYLAGVRLSCQIMLFAFLVAACISSSLFDLGGAFYIAAGCAVAARRVERGETLYMQWERGMARSHDPEIAGRWSSARVKS
ncbi:hypothetical protein CLBKND_01012 [Methylorubrum aminovorans]